MGADPHARRLKAVEALPKTLPIYAESQLPTSHGLFRTLVFRQPGTTIEHVALVHGKLDPRKVALVRVHSECLTSEVFGSLKCDCRQQLDAALDLIVKRGSGVLVYLRQEGRGIGLGNKIRAYALQSEGADTYEANRKLGFPEDLRRYDLAAAILRTLGVQRLDLITNNPLKVQALKDEGLDVRKRVASPAKVNDYNRHYLETKRKRSGHLIKL
jgi:GTP cyclohydrolase II